jgi:anti-sigma regulatory factor (Ser/Thr protein kinase)
VPAGTQRAALDLEADPTAAGTARRFLRRQLEEWGVDDEAVDNALLCLSELVNNVIMHARTASRLTVSLEDGRLWVMVRDLGGAVPGGATSHQPIQDTDEFRVFGRGLTLVDALSDDWGSERDAVGTTAWFAFEVDPSDDVRAG